MKRQFTLIMALLIFSCIEITNAQTELWSMTGAGGENRFGTIFKMDLDGGNYIREHDFYSEFPGANPNQTTLLEASDGKLYGMTTKGGSYDGGVIFSYDPVAGTYAKLYD
ncbi:MAG TPA: choice-of-anchor tandem repeat GloVer-containing protein, partial [Chitinophagales bacterium]|nr:choice-of-anchor tandem repeat GloVer-containing protein [Chitinophagales bacterium]